MTSIAVFRRRVGPPRESGARTLASPVAVGLRTARAFWLIRSSPAQPTARNLAAGVAYGDHVTSIVSPQDDMSGGVGVGHGNRGVAGAVEDGGTRPDGIEAEPVVAVHSK
jgi:hypothetical protein